MEVQNTKKKKKNPRNLNQLVIWLMVIVMMELRGKVVGRRKRD